jgi:hypothetical protein
LAGRSKAQDQETENAMERRLRTTGFVAANITATVIASTLPSGSVVSASAADEPERSPGAD